MSIDDFKIDFEWVCPSCNQTYSYYNDDTIPTCPNCPCFLFKRIKKEVRESREYSYLSAFDSLDNHSSYDSNFMVSIRFRPDMVSGNYSYVLTTDTGIRRDVLEPGDIYLNRAAAGIVTVVSTKTGSSCSIKTPFDTDCMYVLEWVQGNLQLIRVY
jgi:hypothetical protein